MGRVQVVAPFVGAEDPFEIFGFQEGVVDSFTWSGSSLTVNSSDITNDRSIIIVVDKVVTNFDSPIIIVWARPEDYNHAHSIMGRDRYGNFFDGFYDDNAYGMRYNGSLYATIYIGGGPFTLNPNAKVRLLYAPYKW